MSLCGHSDHRDKEEMQQLCISLVPIFNHLQLDVMKEIASTTQSSHYERNQEIFGAGENSDSLYIVHRGKVKVYRLSESGKEQLIRILDPGDFIGEQALFTESVHENYAVALEKTELCVMKRSELQALLLQYPMISFKIMEEFSRRLGQAEKQVSSLTSEATEKRIATYLVELAEGQQAALITLPMTKKDLASYLGTTPETVSRKLTEFQEQHWIEQVGQGIIRIINKDALSAL